MAGSMMEERIDFSDILHRSRELRDLQEASKRAFSDSIPRLERALPQIDTESRRRVAETVGGHQDTSASDQQALRFLSERGIPTGNLAESLKNGAALEDAFTPIAALPDTDVGGHLLRLQQDIIMEAMGRELQHAKGVARRHIATRSDTDWDATKRERLAALPVRTSQQTPSKRNTPSGVFASPFRFSRDTDASTDANAPVFQAVVHAAVHARCDPTRVERVATFFDDALVKALAPRGDARGAPRSVQNLHVAFTALRYITGEAGGNPPREGEYTGLVLPHDRRRAMLGALKFLCLQFREDTLRREVAANPVQAARGGIPGIQDDVRAYLNILYYQGWPEELSSGATLNGMPLWPQVYYCMRCGDYNEAHEIVQASVKKGTFDKSVLLFNECMTAYIASGDERQLPEELLLRLVQGYGLHVRRNLDPYQHVCFVVLARLNPAAGDKMSLDDQDYNYLAKSIEDYLWLRLSVVRLDDDPPLPSSLTSYGLQLRDVQAELREFGPSHFDPRGDQAVFYAHLLILTGQYSLAIEYLDKVTDSCAEALHICFVLYYYGMLRDGHNPDEEEMHRHDELAHECLTVDYSKVLWRYVMKFARSNPAIAVVYLFTVRESGERNRLLKRLLLETNELKLLVGGVGLSEPDAMISTKSVFEEMWPLAGREGVTSGGWIGVVESAAETADENGDALTAITLYNVCRKYGRVCRLLIDRLAAELTSRGSPLRDRIARDGQAFRERMRRNVMDTRRDLMLEVCMPSLDALLQLYKFFDCLWVKDSSKAWTILAQTGLLPRNQLQLVGKTQELRAGNSRWDDKLCDRVPDVVLAGMECLVAMYTDTQRTQTGSIAAQRMNELKEQSQVLINFAAMIGSSSADLSARLMRYELLLS